MQSSGRRPCRLLICRGSNREGDVESGSGSGSQRNNKGSRKGSLVDCRGTGWVDNTFAVQGNRLVALAVKGHARDSVKHNASRGSGTGAGGSYSNLCSSS